MVLETVGAPFKNIGNPAVQPVQKLLPRAETVEQPTVLAEIFQGANMAVAQLSRRDAGHNVIVIYKTESMFLKVVVEVLGTRLITGTGLAKGVEAVHRHPGRAQSGRGQGGQGGAKAVAGEP